MKNKLNDNNLNLSGGLSVSDVGKYVMKTSLVLGCIALGVIVEHKFGVSKEIEYYAKQGVKAIIN